MALFIAIETLIKKKEILLSDKKSAIIKFNKEINLIDKAIKTLATKEANKLIKATN